MPSTVPNAARRIGVVLTLVTAVAAGLTGFSGARSLIGSHSSGGHSGAHVLADLEWDVVRLGK